MLDILDDSTESSEKGCSLLKNHLEIVFSDFSNRSANLLFFNCFSANTTFILFIIAIR